MSTPSILTSLFQGPEVFTCGAGSSEKPATPSAGSSESSQQPAAPSTGASSGSGSGSDGTTFGNDTVSAVSSSAPAATSAAGEDGDCQVEYVYV